jgi:osmoprotectant transport system permease protein
VNEQLILLPGLLAAHIELSLFALLLGAAISIPLGIFVTRHARAQAVVLTVASVIQTIPSLALLAIMVPLLALLSRFLQAHGGPALKSIGYLPALIALLLYSILPILRNTVTGLAGVDPALVQAAMGVGMTPWQRLWRVELPQALPIIVAGVRTAMVWVVGMTVLSTPVGAASLGNYIFSGLQTRNHAAVLVGCVAAAALALFLDWLIRSVELGLQHGRVWRFRLAVACLTALYGFVAVATVQRLLPQAQVIRIGAKAFTEQYILAEILAAQVRKQTGKQVEVVQSLGSTMAYDAVKSGAIDAYVDYSGALWTTLMQQKNQQLPRAAVLQAVTQFVRRDAGIAVAAKLGFSNTYVLAMRRQQAAAQGIATLDQLAHSAGGKRIAGDYEVFTQDAYTNMLSRYKLRFAAQRSMDPSLMYQALLDGEVDVVTAYSSDGRLAAFDLRLLQDTQQILPPYDAVVLAGNGVQRDPAIMKALAALQGSISLKQMQALNYAVDHDQLSPAKVAQKFIAQMAQR